MVVYYQIPALVIHECAAMLRSKIRKVVVVLEVGIYYSAVVE